MTILILVGVALVYGVPILIAVWCVKHKVDKNVDGW